MTDFIPDANVQALLDEFDRGGMITARFTKMDGTERTMTFRGGVYKHMPRFKAGEITRDEAKAALVERRNADVPRGILTVFEPKERDYRRVNLTGLIEAKVAGQTITF